MSLEEYEIECLRKEAEMEDEYSREKSKVENEHWIAALEEALRRISQTSDQAHLTYRQVKAVLLGISSKAKMNLPKCHEKYMDQQGDEPNKKQEG